MRPLWQLLLKSDEELPDKTESGIYIPGIARKGFANNERRHENEDRPMSATVVAIPSKGFHTLDWEPGNHSVTLTDAMDRGDFREEDAIKYLHSRGDWFPMVDHRNPENRKVWDAFWESNRNVRDAFTRPIYTAPMRRVDWRMPEVGDTVWFGFNDWRWDRGEAYMWPDSIHLVIPADGSEPWAMGKACIMEQIREAPTTASGIVKSHRPGMELGRGIVKMTGDGFRHFQPNIKPGDVVRFPVTGAGNMVLPNPFGVEYGKLSFWSVEGIERDPQGIDGLEEREAVAKEIEKDASKIKLSLHTLGMDPQALAQEVSEAKWKKGLKKTDRLYHGHRINH